MIKNKSKLGHWLSLMAFCYLFMLPGQLNAHTNGASLEKKVAGYTVDIGYSPEILMEDSPVRFDFSVVETSSSLPQEFSDIWVRIEFQDRLMFAGGLGKAKFGATGMSYTFPDPGSYTVFSRFSNASGTLVETDFELNITPQQTSFFETEIPWYLVALSLIGVVSLALLLWFIKTWLGTKSGVLNQKDKYHPPEPRTHFFGTTILRLFSSLLIVLIFATIGYYLTGLAMSMYQKSSLSLHSFFALVEKPGEVSVVLTNQGFEPAAITIAKGTKVTFSSATGKPFWPASNLHPSHELYPEFDPLGPIAPNETWSLVFEEVGVWEMHDHIRSYFTGKITVVE